MRPYVPWLAAILSLELLSALTIFHPQAQIIALVILTILVFVLAWRRPAVAASLLLMEYIIGSKGALLRAGGDGLGHGGVPLRIAWFGAFFLGWLFWSFQNKTYRQWGGYVKGRENYLVLGVVLVYAFVRGLALHHPFVFDDANAWGVWLLLLPVIDLTYHKWDELRQFVPKALMVAFIWLAIKTLGLFYLFSHLTNQGWLDAIYLWVRRTGVGEITRVFPGVNAWRVFFQSHIYVLPVIVGGTWYAVFHQKLSKVFWAIWILAWATAIVSLSRSLFIGIGVGLMGSLVLCVVVRHATPLLPGTRSEGGRTTPLHVGVRAGMAVVTSLMLVTALFYAPPRPSGSLLNLLASRVDAGDAASVSRWKLLPILLEGVKRHPVLGSGFGATVTYKSSDPRVVAATGGTYTTYAFEWGWLDHWFKFGIVGIPLLLWIVLRLMGQGWRSSYEGWVRGAIVCSLIGLAVTHVFTPYLNHPLGIVWLIVLEAMMLGSTRGSSATTKTA